MKMLLKASTIVLMLMATAARAAISETYRDYFQKVSYITAANSVCERNDTVGALGLMYKIPTPSFDNRPIEADAPEVERMAADAVAKFKANNALACAKFRKWLAPQVKPHAASESEVAMLNYGAARLKLCKNLKYPACALSRLMYHNLMITFTADQVMDAEILAERFLNQTMQGDFYKAIKEQCTVEPGRNLVGVYGDLELTDDY